jgi:hypothetical protein
MHNVKKQILKNITIKYAPRNDREKLRVRINEQDKPDGIHWYDYVKIKVSKTGKSIVCKLHGDDIYEIKPEYRKGSIIRINEPLRDKLGVKVRDILDFEIEKKPKWLAWCYFVRYHPDDTVVVATWLGIIAIIITVILGFISIKATFCP